MRQSELKIIRFLAGTRLWQSRREISLGSGVAWQTVTKYIDVLLEDGFVEEYDGIGKNRVKREFRFNEKLRQKLINGWAEEDFILGTA